MVIASLNNLYSTIGNPIYISLESKYFESMDLFD